MFAEPLSILTGSVNKFRGQVENGDEGDLPAVGEVVKHANRFGGRHDGDNGAFPSQDP